MLRSRKTSWCGRSCSSCSMSGVLFRCSEQPSARAGVTSEEVERAIRQGVRFLKERQRADGSWADADQAAQTGTTSLVALALLTAGEKADSPTIQRALEFLRQIRPDQLNSTYAIALQTMVFAAAEPETRPAADPGQCRMARARPDQSSATGCPGREPGTILKSQGHPGDNSNTQYALLGLNAASEAGLTVRPEVWALSRTYFELSQNRDGGWGYTPRHKQSTASMTCAGHLQPDLLGLEAISESRDLCKARRSIDCGKGGFDPFLNRGIDWLANHFDVQPELRARPAVEDSITFTDSSGPAGSPVCGSSARTTGIAWAPKRSSARRTRSPGSGAGAAGERGRGDQLCPAVPGQGSCAGLDQQASAISPRRLEQRRRRRSQHGRRSSRTTGKPAHLAGRRPRAPPRIQDMLQAPIAFFNGHEAPEFSARAQAEPPRLRRAGGLHLRRGLLRQLGHSTRVSSA